MRGILLLPLLLLLLHRFFFYLPKHLVMRLLVYCLNCQRAAHSGVILWHVALVWATPTSSHVTRPAPPKKISSLATTSTAPIPPYFLSVASSSLSTLSVAASS